MFEWMQPIRVFWLNLDFAGEKNKQPKKHTKNKRQEQNKTVPRQKWRSFFVNLVSCASSVSSNDPATREEMFLSWDFISKEQ